MFMRREFFHTAGGVQEFSLLLWLAGTATPRCIMQVNKPTQQRVVDVFTANMHACYDTLVFARPNFLLFCY